MTGPLLLFLRILMTVILYAFLILIMIVLWNNLHQQSLIVAHRKIPPIKLTLLSPSKNEETNAYDQSEVTIGRDSSCNIHVEDDLVSGQHARICFHHGQWWIEDNTSRNGTYLNKEKLTMPTILVPDDVITIGNSSIKVIL